MIEKKVQRKSELIERVSEMTGISKVDTLIVIEAAFKEIGNAWMEGRYTAIRGFGMFQLKKRAAKIGQNIKRGGAVHIPESYLPTLKVAKELKDRVNKVHTATDSLETPAPDQSNDQPEVQPLPF